MPKNLVVDPKEIRKPGVIKIKDIPVNSYVYDIKKELKTYGKDGLKKIYYDMLIIREFEMMLNAIKQEGNYLGIEYNHRGPAHLSGGQESAAVGQCINLNENDLIFGSHRSHGEILAKGFSAVNKIDDASLQKIMEEFGNGRLFSVVEKEAPGKSLNSSLISSDLTRSSSNLPMASILPSFRTII